jgi:UDP-N-acetylmuramyl pentapeptide phosphotransferase/UDP-N-acetylglucosamine-1-phosphate transferase
MGDVGSIFLGFTFVSIALIASKSIKEFLMLLIFQSVFYIDCIITIILRKYRQERIFQAHLYHFYQRLVHTKNYSHVTVTLIYGIIQTIIGIIVLIIPQNIISVIIVWIILFAVYVLLRLTYLREVIWK